jgi:hypothetical protein
MELIQFHQIKWERCPSVSAYKGTRTRQFSVPSRRRLEVIKLTENRETRFFVYDPPKSHALVIKDGKAKNIGTMTEITKDEVVYRMYENKHQNLERSIRRDETRLLQITKEVGLSRERQRKIRRMMDRAKGVPDA